MRRTSYSERAWVMAKEKTKGEEFSAIGKETITAQAISLRSPSIWARKELSDKSAPMAVFLTHLECFTASSARRRVAGPLSAAKVAIWARLPMAT